MPTRKDYEQIWKAFQSNIKRMNARYEVLLNRQVREIADLIRDGATKSHILDLINTRFKKEYADFKRPWALAFATAAYKIQAKMLGKRNYADVGGKSAVVADPYLFGSDELLANHLKKGGIEDWINKTSKLETQTTANLIGNIIEEGAVQDERGYGRTPQQMARYMLDEGLAGTPSRAKLMSETLTAYAYNNGAKQLYKDDGIGEMEWLVTEDDVLCEFCQQMAGKTLGTDKETTWFGEGDTMEGTQGSKFNFGIDIENPPLHPQCRCTIIPVI